MLDKHHVFSRSSKSTKKAKLANNLGKEHPRVVVLHAVFRVFKDVICHIHQYLDIYAKLGPGGNYIALQLTWAALPRHEGSKPAVEQHGRKH